MNNKTIVAMLQEITLLFELKGENPFKVKAYANAARSIETLEEDLKSITQEDRLKRSRASSVPLISKPSDNRVFSTQSLVHDMKEEAMEKESNQKRVKEIIKILSKEIPDSKIALKFSNPLELLIATILSAQCTDVKVNQVTADLFKKYRSAKDYAEADMRKFEEEVRPTGFYRNKAKAIQKCCQELVHRFGGKVPQTLEDLVSFPGVGRKTANVLLGNAFGVPGIVVDTHVQRVSQRIGLTKNEDPVKIEFDLMEIVPKEKWTHFSNLLIWHGRKTCVARKPLCERCPIRKLCDYGSEVSTKSQAPNE